MRQREPLKDFPVCLQLDGRRVLVVGAGEVATRRIASLQRAGAKVTVVAPEATPLVELMAKQGQVDWRRRAYQKRDLRGKIAVFAASSDRRVNRLVAQDARSGGVLVNAADDPQACDFTMPAVARHGPITLAVSTCGLDPGGAGRIRDALSARLVGVAGPLADEERT